MKPLFTILTGSILFFANAQEIKFQDHSLKSNNNYFHSFEGYLDPMPLRVSGGVAVGDINNDDLIDLFFVLGDGQLGLMLLNKGDGDFEDITDKANLNLPEFKGSGPLFFNFNQDEYIDLIIGSVNKKPPAIFKNNGDLTFTKVKIPEFEVLNGMNTGTITAVDYNKDGLDDLFFSHWLEDPNKKHFWQKKSNGTYLCADSLLNFNCVLTEKDFSFSANFFDFNNDHYPDLFLCSDFGTSQIWLNQSGVEFELDKQNILTDENGMGGTIGDFDNDGDFDWFVSSVYDNDGILEGNWGSTGNKLYLNNGNGMLLESAENYGVENASWGWGTSFADFNNDGYLDIITVNGWPQGSAQFRNDSTKIFMSKQAAYFTEEAENFNLIDTLQGRGLGCLDFDNDGDLDFVVSNYRGPIKIWKNELKNKHNYLSVKVKESDHNPFGFGVKLNLYSGNLHQTRLIQCGTNYLSQNANIAHFGLGAEINDIDSLVIEWNDQTRQTEYNISLNQNITISKIDEIENEAIGYEVYPNPSKQMVNAKFKIDNFTTRKYTCEVFDIEGKNYLTLTPSSVTANLVLFKNINISKFESGTYFITLKNNNNILKTTNFIKI